MSFSSLQPILRLSLALFLGCVANVRAAEPSQPVRVACIGDSITQGVGVAKGRSYPEQLQTLLGKGWEVRNFGVSGRTLLRKGDHPYWKENAFREAQDFAPDVVVIMLGTNDTKPQNWQFKDEFVTDYIDLVRTFQALPSKPRVFVCRPCPVPNGGNFMINEPNVLIEIPLIDKTAAETGAGVIDIHAALLPFPELLPDRVHPDTRGAGVIAATVAEKLTSGKLAPMPNSLFSDHAVLQQGAKIPVWGTAYPGERVTVEFAGRKVSTMAKDGQWSLELPALSASAESRVLTISGSRGGTRRIEDVLVGEVWIASGQSNMERELGPRKGQKDLPGWQQEVTSAAYPQIRQFYVPQQTAARPVPDALGSWSVCSPSTASAFTAVGYYFARDLHKARRVPVAILHTSWGGTDAEAWTPESSLAALPGYEGALATLTAAQRGETTTPVRQKWFEECDPGSRPGAGWQEPGFDAADWTPIAAPALLSKTGLDKHVGVVWFRKEIDVPAASAGLPARLLLGRLDDLDTTWVNGVLVGSSDSAGQSRDYAMPQGLLKPGRNVIAVRLVNIAGDGGWHNSAPTLDFSSAAPALPLVEGWRQRAGVLIAQARPFPPPLRFDQNSASALYNAMIKPLQPFPIAGVIWYQGENNGFNAGRANRYADLFTALVQGWRGAWGRGNFPFLFVQIAPFQKLLPEIREAQRVALGKLPAATMVVTTDVGDATDIHPAQKEPVGQRLALAARALAYGEKLEYSGPLPVRATAKDGSLTVDFEHAGTGLEFRNGDGRGFELAGSDGVFAPAQAQIEGNHVVLKNPSIGNPVSVRYGWANVPDVNLFNREGLPATPFLIQAETPSK